MTPQNQNVVGTKTIPTSTLTFIINLFMFTHYTVQSCVGRNVVDVCVCVCVTAEKWLLVNSKKVSILDLFTFTLAEK